MFNGSTAAWLAMAAAAVAAVLALVGFRRRDPRLSLAAASMLTVSTALSTWALVRLGQAFADQDYANAYVSQYSRRGTSRAYRVAGIWGGMNGSLLLWTVLSSWVATAAAWLMPGSLRRRVLRVAIFAAVIAGYLLINLLFANPFDLLDIPAVRGAGLVPILEHPAMLYHPPLLYLGLVVGLAVFADAIADGFSDAGEAERRDAVRARRRWMLASWVLLVVGMATGANWAYVELGWGGYWAWDPIENTALMPWLAITVALHIGRMAWIGPSARVLIGTVPYVLASVGTLLTRSGATVSVHAFGEVESIGRSLLVVSAAVSALAAVGVWRAHRLSGQVPTVRRLGLRRGGLIGAATLFAAATAAVLAATLWPLIVGSDRAIQGGYYSRILTPLTVVGLLAVAVVPALNDSDRRFRAARLVPGVVGFAFGLIAAAVAGWSLLPSGVVVAAASAAAFGVVGAAVGRSAPTPLGVHLGHLGFAVLLVAIAGSTAGDDQINTLGVGERMSVGGYELELRDVAVRFDDDAQPAETVVAVVDVFRGSRLVDTLEPRRDAYTDKGAVLAENALRSNPLDDVQVSLRAARGDRAQLQVHVRPLAWWLWWGAGLMAVGGTISAAKRKRRPIRKSLRIDSPEPRIGVDHT